MDLIDRMKLVYDINWENNYLLSRTKDKQLANFALDTINLIRNNIKGETHVINRSY